MIKLVATDLDGTLLNGTGKLSRRTIEVFEELKSRKCKIVIASGRTPEEIINIIAPLGLMDYENAFLVAYNGVSTIQTKPYKIINEMMLSPSDTNFLANYLSKKNMKIHIFAKNKLLVSHDIEYILNFTPSPKFEIIRYKMDEYRENIEVYKLLIFDEESRVNHFRDQLDSSIKERFNVFKSSNQLLEFVHLLGSKGEAVKRICHQFNIFPDEVLAFGDEENDISMIEFAGIGVAMANAKAIVKTKAKITTLSNDYDGVAEVVQHYILDRR